jgi:hypothetical protein
MNNGQIKPEDLKPEHHPNLEAIEARELELLNSLWDEVYDAPGNIVDVLQDRLIAIQKTQNVKNNLIQIAYSTREEGQGAGQERPHHPTNGLSSVS